MLTSSSKMAQLTQIVASDVPIQSGETKNFQVELPLPADAAGSMRVRSRKMTCPKTRRYNNACVLWHAGVTVHHKGGSQDKLDEASRAQEQEVTIVEPFQATPPEEPVESGEGEPVTSCFCLKKGSVQMIGKLNQGAYSQGDTVSFSYGVTNKTRLDVKDFLVEIWQHGVWEAGGRIAHESWQLTSTVVKGVSRGDSFGCSEGSDMQVVELKLPEEGTLIQSMDRGHIVFHHFVLLTPRFAGGTFMTAVPFLRVPFSFFCRPGAKESE
eukprot:gb/GFBE01067899.1/.p1 GENE.gb/GFBE01067899.1/~~gb/GFBE01067899.1/.p1  ORF type:complete len:268 (+),score=53.34 gb/GFBE01067899.1/:1-804(+)